MATESKETQEKAQEKQLKGKVHVSVTSVLHASARIGC